MTHDLTVDGEAARATAPVARHRLPRWLASLVRSAASAFQPAAAPSAAAQAQREAAVVREMALRVQVCEPGFASDLLAAADRHERRFAAER